MAKTFSRVLLVTANVGSIFEEPDKMIPIWMREFLAVVTRLEPEFLAIHCQEVGGKNYEDTMQHVNKFIKLLLASEEMQQFTRARVFLDEDFTAVEKFTALGSLYFIHHSVASVEIFDFEDAQFVPLEGKEVLSGNIEHVRIKEKAKFAQEFFPDFVWSRKGFIRTRWSLYGTVFDLVNIHLIHDVSNVMAMETSPSTYCGFRVRALLHTIERFERDRYDKVPFFVFGDFNFRLDTHELVKKLTEETIEQRILGKKNDVSKVIFKQQDNGKVILTVGKKDFHHHEHNLLFSRQNAMTLQCYDKEPDVCRSKLFEYKVSFPPSYPFSEDSEDGTSYMPTRCPGWCDRIMMSYDAHKLLHVENGFTSEYKMIGMHICMGDHKPIYLNLQIRHSMSGNDLDSAQVSASSPQMGVGDIEGVDGDLIGNGEHQIRKHPPIRHVVSVNGEEEDVENINIHDFSTFEQEELIGTHFIGSLKRKSADSVGGSVAKGPRRGLNSFRQAVRTVLSSEAVMRALKHYAHRSDSEDTEEDEDSQVSCPVTTSVECCSNNIAQTTNEGETGGSKSSIAGVPNSVEMEACSRDKTELDVNSDLEEVKKVVECPTAIGLEMEEKVADFNALPSGDNNISNNSNVVMDSTGSQLTAADNIVVTSPVEEVVAVIDMAASRTCSGPPLAICDSHTDIDNINTSNSKEPLLERDLPADNNLPMATLGSSADAADNVDDAETAQPTDGLLSRRPESTTVTKKRTRCNCCSVQ